MITTDQPVNPLFRPGIPLRFQGAAARQIECVLSKDNFKSLSKWATRPSGNLVLEGPPGRGKTYAAIACMYFFENYHGIPWSEQIFIELADLNQEWLCNIKDPKDNYTLLEKIKKKQVVVFDDLAIKAPSESFLEFLYTAINHRVNDPALITIYTTNLGSKGVSDAMGPRMVSRIYSGCNIKFEGDDFRLKKPYTSLIS